MTRRCLLLASHLGVLGGLRSAIIAIRQALIGLGWEVTVASYEPTGTPTIPDGYLIPHHFHVWTAHAVKRLQKSIIENLCKLGADGSYDIVWSRDAVGAWAATEAWPKTPVIFHPACVIEHIYLDNLKALPWWKPKVAAQRWLIFPSLLARLSKIEGEALTRSLKVVCFSQSLADQLREVHTRRNFSVAVIPPGVDTGRYHPDDHTRATIRTNLRLGSEQVVLISVGRMVPEKNLSLVAEAIAGLDEKPFWIVVGGGAQEALIRREIYRWIAPELVCFTGTTESPERYMAASDALILASFRESLGQVLIEAAACGLWLMAPDSRLPGVQTASREVLEGLSAFYWPSADAEGCSKALKAFLDLRPNERKGGGVHNATQSHIRFNWEQHVRQVIGLLREK
ncbi:MAG: glycosyltransferase family 4 protein [bacterium]